MRLDEFLCDKDISEFFNTEWGRNPFFFSKSAFNLEEPEFLLTSLLKLPRLRYPQVRVLNGGGAINPILYTTSNRHGLSESLVNSKVLSLAVAPNTIKIENLASLDPIFEHWAINLERIFSSRITLNGYFSFGPSDGIPAHYDPHHIFAIQLYGKKTWRLGVGQTDFFPHSSLTMPDDSKCALTEERNLNAGEMLYLPPGRLHSVRTEQQSVHITAGIHTPRCFQAISVLLEKAATSHPELRGDMPFVASREGLKFRALSNKELEIAFNTIKFEHEKNYFLDHG